MDVLTCTLMADGASDRVLIPKLQWLLDRHCPSACALNFAERRSSRSNSLGDRITAALADYPCNLLFVHRDAEAEADAPASRQQEIEAAWACRRAARMKSSDPPSFTALSALPSFAGLEMQVQQRFHR